MDFLFNNLKYVFVIVLFVCVFFLGKYLFHEFTGEIVTEQFIVEDKKYSVATGDHPDRFYMIAEGKEFRIKKDDYNHIEIGDSVYVKYNKKTLTVRGNVEY